MRLALYENHHLLPFWHSPANPYGLFDPKWAEIDPLKTHWITPVLLGLVEVEIPALAHVSIIINPDGTFETPKRIWVQITTSTREQGADGLPLVVKDGVVQVVHLWGGDNGTRSPFNLPCAPAEDSPSSYWRDFFLAMLKIAAEEAHNDFRKATDKMHEASAHVVRFNVLGLN